MLIIAFLKSRSAVLVKSRWRQLHSQNVFKHPLTQIGTLVHFYVLEIYMFSAVFVLRNSTLQYMVFMASVSFVALFYWNIFYSLILLDFAV